MAPVRAPGAEEQPNSTGLTRRQSEPSGDPLGTRIRIDRSSMARRRYRFQFRLPYDFRLIKHVG
jgi:hypothetical protein